jgi:predicted Rossmann fold flavoprotein
MMDADVIIIGAGAAGLMCAISAGRHGKKVIVLDHGRTIAEKIRISGGGRCNFTNLHCAPNKYLSANPHFCVSALKRYTQHDFIALVERHGIPYHEKTLGQLFCDRSAKDLITMLLNECADAGVSLRHPVTVSQVTQNPDGHFMLKMDQGEMTAQSLVIATGGLSIPKIGATGFGYTIAKQFGIPLVSTRAGLVPLTFDEDLLSYTRELSGIAVDPINVSSRSGQNFREAMLLTHRGISGPAILQISSYWQQGEAIVMNLAPDLTLFDWLIVQRREQPRAQLHTILADLFSKRLAQSMVMEQYAHQRIADLSDKHLQEMAQRINQWTVVPSGSEGYRTAEVTLGGVDTDALSSKTFEARNVKNLYFIGEVVDVTGHLGGYNFQWAWSSGWCAGQYV